MTACTTKGLLLGLLLLLMAIGSTVLVQLLRPDPEAAAPADQALSPP